MRTRRPQWSRSPLDCRFSDAESAEPAIAGMFNRVVAARFGAGVDINAHAA